MVYKYIMPKPSENEIWDELYRLYGAGKTKEQFIEDFTSAFNIDAVLNSEKAKQWLQDDLKDQVEAFISRPQDFISGTNASMSVDIFSFLDVLYGKADIWLRE